MARRRDAILPLALACFIGAWGAARADAPAATPQDTGVEQRPLALPHGLGLRTGRVRLPGAPAEPGLAGLRSRKPGSASGLGRIAGGPPALVWRLGDNVVRPPGADEPLKAEPWSAGISSVAVAIEGVRMYGTLPSERCALAGDVDRGGANAVIVQPFVNYNLTDGWYVASLPVITADWAAPAGQRWTIPVGAELGRVARVGPLPISIRAGYYYNVEQPDGRSDWALRLQLRVLFPG